jgi:homoserine O-acetyltransferase
MPLDKRGALLAVRLFAVIVSVALCVGQSHAQSAQKPAQICKLGDLKLESGQIVQSFPMNYITSGELNDGKADAVLSLHGLRGNLQ